MPKVTMICSFCESENVIRDAWVRWDKEKQEWGILQVTDLELCQNCAEEYQVHGDTEIIKKDI